MLVSGLFLFDISMTHLVTWTKAFHGNADGPPVANLWPCLLLCFMGWPNHSYSIISFGSQRQLISLTTGVNFIYVPLIPYKWTHKTLSIQHKHIKTCWFMWLWTVKISKKTFKVFWDWSFWKLPSENFIISGDNKLLQYTS